MGNQTMKSNAVVCFFTGITLVLGVLPALLFPQTAAAEEASSATPGTQGATMARATALKADVVLKVVHVEKIRKQILEEVKGLGGFHVLVTDNRLDLKVPPENLSEAIKTVTVHGLVISKSIQRTDLTQEIAQLEGALRSKQEIFERLETLVNQSDLSSTLNIERTMGQLVSEIEQAKGRLRVETERAQWAVINLSFQYRARQEIVYVESPFAWLNNVELPRFIREF